MKKLAVFVVAMVLGIIAMLGAISVAPASLVAAPSIVKVQDECMCGGYIYFTLRSRSFNGSETTCVYDVWSNGQHLPWALYRTWAGNVACGPNG